MESISSPSPLKEFWQSFSHNKGALAGLAFMIVIVACALFAPWLAPYDPVEQHRDFLLQGYFRAQSRPEAFQRVPGRPKNMYKPIH